MTIDFGAACSYLFKTKQKWQTLLLLSVCILIPVVGQIVVMGYLYRRHGTWARRAIQQLFPSPEEVAG